MIKGSINPVHLNLPLSRQQFDELTVHLVEATKAPVQQAMEDAHITQNDIGKVLLVGGSTRIPAVQAKVKSLTGKDGFKGINPDECVAVGAALQGGVLIGEVKGLVLIDVTPLSLGIETVGDMCTRLIERNTAIPISKSKVFTTAAPFQSSVEIKVLQGERPRASQNKSLGKFRLKGIRRAMAGVPQIEVTFTIDANGIVNVAARDLKTGKAQDITIETSSNMSESEITDAIKDAEKYAGEDKKFREGRETRSKLRGLIIQAEEIERKLIKEKNKDEFKKARALFKEPIKAANTALRGKDDDAISVAASILEHTISEFNKE
jgi:molecular chaperone DnaK